jgi:hypothetical protein
MCREQGRNRACFQPSGGLLNLLGADLRSRPFDLQYERGSGPRTLVAKRRTHVCDVDAATPQFMINPGMFIHSGTALMHDEGDPLRCVSTRVAFGSHVTDARAGLSHDRHLGAQLPMLEASPHATSPREEAHLMVGGSRRETLPKQLRMQARVNVRRIQKHTHRDHLGSTSDARTAGAIAGSLTRVPRGTIRFAR